jgi:amidohydrolase
LVTRFLCLLCGVAAYGQQFDDRIRKETDAIQTRLVETRRELARHPEVSNREVWTGKFIATRLRQLGFEDVRTGVAGNGVVAVLKGEKPGPVVAWRSDMDGLPIQDARDTPY